MCRYSRSVRPARKPRKLGGPKTNAAIRRARKLREEWIALPVPAIVDEASFQQAQAQLARNAALSFRRNTERRYLLRCLLTCGIGSGVRMIGARRSTGCALGRSSRPRPNGLRSTCWPCAPQGMEGSVSRHPCTPPVPPRARAPDRAAHPQPAAGGAEAGGLGAPPRGVSHPRR